MKDKKIIIIIVSIILIVISIILFVFINKKEDERPIVEPPIDKTPVQKENIHEKYNSLDEFNNSDDGHELSATLSTYGHDMLNNKTYLNLRKNASGTYFATKQEIKDLGYDVSIIDPNCTDDTPILYLYVDENGNPTNDINTVMYIMSCTLK